MAFNQHIFFYELKRRFGPIMIGGLVGAAAAYYAISQGYDLNALASAGKGLIDAVFNRTAVTEIAAYKVYSVFIFLGITVGFFGDILLDKLGFKRKRRK